MWRKLFAKLCNVHAFQKKLKKMISDCGVFYTPRESPWQLNCTDRLKVGGHDD